MFDNKGTNLIRKASADEIVGHRDRALELYARGLELIEEATKAERLAHRSSSDSVYAIERFGRSPMSPDQRARWMKSVRQTIDSKVWRYCASALGLANYMDASELERFHSQISNDPPEITRETLSATFDELWRNRDKTFTRGLVNVFRRLDQRYRTNSTFRVTPKTIIAGVLNGDRGTAQISDLDRIFHILDGKSPKDGSCDAAAIVRQAVGWQPKRAEVSTNYMSFKLYENGNAHVRFLRQDLLDEANRMIAMELGDVLPDDRPRDKHHAPQSAA